ncbi:ankyrin repeat domain-containing protein [Aspergillus puulaauensis]|uniref:Ankyrin repeat-containing domain protein n=1 Tax=Aspergillus puulaauensis TaxID=1220207 RepID=A0A7R8AHA5_9EURO|nr:uncharacterized protein APUU_12277A [Aspergillus puulaauensis]BCS19449.1 hypothetical protein APUU_12277A [Aspergillus puulaauensis]
MSKATMKSCALPFDVQYLILRELSQRTQSQLSESDWQSIVNALCVCRRWYDCMRRLLIQNHPASTLLEVCKPAGKFALEQLAADYTTRENTTTSSWTPTTYSARLYQRQAKVADSNVGDVLVEDIRNCMCVAVLLGDVDCLTTALKTGVDPRDCFRPYIITGGHIPVLEFLLDGGYININTQPNGTSLLADAVLNEKADVVSFLLARGADINIRLTGDSETSLSPVSYAASRDNLEILKILLSHGADIEDPEANHRPIWWAIFHRNLDMARLFIENGANLSPEMPGAWPLCEAASTGHAGMVRLMLEAGGMPQDASDVVHLYYEVVICPNPEIDGIFGVDLASIES